LKGDEDGSRLVAAEAMRRAARDGRADVRRRGEPPQARLRQHGHAQERRLLAIDVGRLDLEVGHRSGRRERADRLVVRLRRAIG
jgi:hypothetical protein